MGRLLTLKNAAELLAVSPEFIKKLRRQGMIKVIRIGRSVRVPEREIERLCREGVQR